MFQQLIPGFFADCEDITEPKPGIKVITFRHCLDTRDLLKKLELTDIRYKKNSEYSVTIWSK